MEFSVQYKNSLAYKAYQYDVFDVPSDVWKRMGKCKLKNAISNGTSYTFDECVSISTEVQFREPKPNECGDSLITEFDAVAVTPMGSHVVIKQEYDADALSEELSYYGYQWGSSYSQGANL